MKQKPRIWEDGDHIYIVAPVSPFTPGNTEIEELAFAEQVKKVAPNEHLLWLRGQYVEADAPNLNNQQWTAGELAIKSLTPMFMPVTVMHDPRTAVGLIADIDLLTPEQSDVRRARIDSTLAVWKHRFPEVAEECQANYEAGTLMQSMEALSPHYSCAECGQVFQKLPEGAERENWCAHLKGESGDMKRGEEGSAAARILGNVTFTGTGLIFGTRGAQGANREAHLEIDQREIAEFHQDQHKNTSTRPRSRDRKVKNVETVEISKAEYDRLQADAAQVSGLTTEVAEAKDAKADLESKVEKAEAEKVEAEGKLEEANKALDEAKEEGRKAELADERLAALGKDFKAKLGEFTSQRLAEQAKSLSDEDWDGRLKELEEMSGVKRDATSEAGGDGEAAGAGKGEGEFSREEIASAGVGAGGSGGDSAEPSPAQRRSVVGSLVSSK